MGMQMMGDIASLVESLQADIVSLQLENLELRERLAAYSEIRRMLEIMSSLPPIGKDEEE